MVDYYHIEVYEGLSPAGRRVAVSARSDAPVHTLVEHLWEYFRGDDVAVDTALWLGRDQPRRGLTQPGGEWFRGARELSLAEFIRRLDLDPASGRTLRLHGLLARSVDLRVELASADGSHVEHLDFLAADLELREADTAQRMFDRIETAFDEALMRFPELHYLGRDRARGGAGRWRVVAALQWCRASFQLPPTRACAAPPGAGRWRDLVEGLVSSRGEQQVSLRLLAAAGLRRETA